MKKIKILKMYEKVIGMYIFYSIECKIFNYSEKKVTNYVEVEVEGRDRYGIAMETNKHLCLINCIYMRMT